MANPNKYEAIYKAQQHALGGPFPEIVKLFAENVSAGSRVLDLGCGQGRDALFIARAGHSVVAVDLSSSGIAQLNAEALQTGLPIEGIVADLVTYEPDSMFDVVVIDRTLHMLRSSERMDVLKRAIGAVGPTGFVVIADERKNLPAMRALFDDGCWSERFAKKGFLFMQREMR
jgi:tellurite methyltransferase